MLLLLSQEREAEREAKRQAELAILREGELAEERQRGLEMAALLAAKAQAWKRILKPHKDPVIQLEPFKLSRNRKAAHDGPPPMRAPQVIRHAQHAIPCTVCNLTVYY